MIDDVNELLGRSGRSVKGKEGVGFVLRSLPENARNLYRVLISELLAAMDTDPNDLNRYSDSEDNSNEGTAHPSKAGRSNEAAIDYRALFKKVQEEFICSSEMAFKQLLKEFHDHQMVFSRRDGAGGEVLGVPFRREEMEGILEGLVE